MTAAARKHGGSSPVIRMYPSPSGERLSAPPSGKSPRKSEVVRPIFPDKAREVAIEHAATIIAAAFPGSSENAVCDLASAALQCDPSTIRSILRKETKRVDFGLVFAALHFIKDPWSLPGMRDFIRSVMSR